MFISTGSDRDKFDALLHLALEQVQALETDNFSEFDRIMAAKDTVIASFRDARGLSASDLAIAGIIQQIQEADKAAQHLLYRKTGLLMREMTAIQQQKQARHAYLSPASDTPREMPRFMDQQS